MRETKLKISNSGNKDAVKVLHYYALFKYPVTVAEIHGSCSTKCSIAEIKAILDNMEHTGKVFRFNEFYSLSPFMEEQVYLRKQANELALKKIKAARICAGIINSFPFVRFVGISGSMSKGYASPNSDFDFFIITEANRLWICRTLLHLFKKLTFIVKRQHSFCMNYFIDTTDLEIEEKNIFTAIELSSLTPVHGARAYAQLQNSNRDWVTSLLPNGYVRFNKPVPVFNKKSIAKRFAEFLLDRCFADKLNEKLMLITDYRWRKKWTNKNYPMTEYDLAFKTTLHISKNHPANHQKRVLEKLKEAGFSNQPHNLKTSVNS
jgi:hypothetical protein